MRTNLRLAIADDVDQAASGELSPSRQHLADLLEIDASLGEQCAERSATIERLRRPIADEAAASDALNALSNTEAAAMAEWARLGDDSAHPQPDIAQRRELEDAYATASAGAAAARSASAVVTAELASLAQEREGKVAAIRTAVYQVLVDELGPVIIEIRDAEKLLLHQLARASSLGDLLIENAARFDNPAEPERLILLRHNTALREALTPFYVEPRSTIADIQTGAVAWFDLAKRLTTDPSATLGDPDVDA